MYVGEFDWLGYNLVVISCDMVGSYWWWVEKLGFVGSGDG